MYYRELISGRHDDKMRLLQTWADDFHDRDGKFAKEFQTTFDPCFWELYLFQAFRELGGSVDLSHTRPDFLVALPDGSRFCAEATIASHAEGYAPAAQPQFEHMPELDARLEYQSLRLANAVSSKLRKFRSDYAALAHVADKPFVLCIAPFDQQWAHFMAERPMRRVLFADDMPLLDVDLEGRRRVVGEAHAPQVVKSNGAEVPFGFFREPGAAPEISAVLFSSVATFGKLTALLRTPNTLVTAVRYNERGTEPVVFSGPLEEYRETVLDGLHLFLNPHAREQLDPGAFVDAGVAVHTIGPDGMLLTNTPDGFLFSRSSVRITSEGLPVPMVPPGQSLRHPTTEPFPEGRAVRVGGSLGTTAEIHLAHHRGWTILAAMDLVDRDWGSQCRPGTHRTVDAFRSANLSDGKGQMVGFHPSLSDGIEAARAWIDVHLGTTVPSAG